MRWFATLATALLAGWVVWVGVLLDAPVSPPARASEPTARPAAEVPASETGPPTRLAPLEPASSIVAPRRPVVHATKKPARVPRLIARVTYADGSPCVGLDVVAFNETGRDRRGAAKTDARGVARIRVPAGYPRPLYVRPAIRGCGLDTLVAWPEAREVSLVIPERGTVELEVVAPDGKPWVGVLRARLDEGPTSVRIVDGRGVVKGVGVDVVFHVDVLSSHIPVRGPPAPGATVARRIEIGSGETWIRGRVVIEEGKSISTRDLRFPGAPIPLPLHGGRRGRFLQPWPSHGSASTLLVHRVIGGEVQGAASVVVPAFAKGRVYDVGTVVLVGPPVVAQGRVVGADGEPLPPAVRTTMCVAHRFGDEDGWGDEHHASIASDGSFSIRRFGATHVALRATGTSVSTLASVRAGTRGVRLVARAAGTVRGRIRVPAGIDARCLRVESWIGGQRFGTIGIREGGLLSATSLPVGFATVLVFFGDTLVAVREVVVAAAGEGETTRADIDLRGVLRRVRVRVVDRDGAPVQRVWVGTVGTGDFAYTDKDGIAALPSAGPANVRFVAIRHRTRVQRIVGDETITLMPAVRVTLRIERADGSAFPKPIQLRCEPNREFGRREPWSRVRWLCSSTTSWRTLETGRFRLSGETVGIDGQRFRVSGTFVVADTPPDVEQTIRVRLRREE